MKATKVVISRSPRYFINRAACVKLRCSIQCSSSHLKTRNSMIEQVCAAIMFQSCIWKVLRSNPDGAQAEVIRDFPQSLQANSDVVPHIKTASFQILSNLFIILYQSTRPAPWGTLDIRLIYNTWKLYPWESSWCGSVRIIRGLSNQLTLPRTEFIAMET
jgi:hypothetical protein